MIPEKEREALMRLTMCAREECIMCKYHKECDFDFQYKLATESMNILAEALRTADRKTEPQTCDDCIWNVCNYNKAFEDEPQMDIHGITDCDFCKHESEEWDSEACDGCCNANNHFEPKDEPQTQLTAKCLNCNNSKVCKEKHWDGCVYEPIEDETQTERSE